ncbi:MAG: RNA polymerase sigma factor [Deltaproteobacteria bacterium]
MLDIARATIEKAARGDIGAFEEIYKRTSSFVYNVAWRVTGNKEDAEEVAQNVFVTVYRKLSGFRHEASLKTWLYRITVNLALNHAKKMSRTRERTLSYDDALAHSAAQLARAEAVEAPPADPGRIEELLKALNPDQRACIVLRGIEGLSYKEIAEALHVNINTVRTRIKRARELLVSLHKKGGSAEVTP